MTSPVTKKERLLAESSKNRITLARSVGTFVAGAVFSLFVQHWFVQLLPGPRVSVLMNKNERPDGCIAYSITLENDEPVDYLYLKIEVPNTIKDAKIGFPSVQSIEGPSGTMFEVGRAGAGGGECRVVQPTAGFQEIPSAITGNLLSTHTSDLPKVTTIFGVIVTNNYESTIQPKATSAKYEGQYRYTKLGIQVTKDVVLSEGASSGSNSSRQ